MSLKNVWKKLQFFAAAHDLCQPSRAVQEVMEKDGWSFQTEHQAVIGGMGGTIVSYTVAKTPEGELVYNSDEDYKRYQEARMAAMEKIYGPRP